METIIGVAKKIFNNEKNHVVIVKKESGEEVKVSAFGKKEPEGLVEGKTYKFDVKESGDFINYNTKTFEEVNLDGEQPKVTTETVGDSRDYFKIKRISSDSEQGFEDAVNKFNSEHEVNFTHTHVVPITGAGATTFMHFATLFYK